MIPSYTTEHYAAAFSEWLRRYNADPTGFIAAYGHPADYGTGCADYFARLLAELFPEVK